MGKGWSWSLVLLLLIATLTQAIDKGAAPESSKEPTPPSVQTEVKTPLEASSSSSTTVAARESGKSKPDQLTSEERLANYTWWLTLATIVLAASTIALWWVTFKASKDTKEMAETAKRANELNERTFTTANRPWLKLHAQVVSALTYSNESWKVQIQFSAENVGSSPAVVATFAGEIVPAVKVLPRGKALGNGLSEEMDSLVKRTHSDRLIRKGKASTVFPNDVRRIKLDVGTSNNTEMFKYANNPGVYSGVFHVLVCVCYGAAFSEDQYVTKQSFAILKMDANGYMDSINLSGDTVELSVMKIDVVQTGITDDAT